jgi:hypothetical protein
MYRLTLLVLDDVMAVGYGIETMLRRSEEFSSMSARVLLCGTVDDVEMIIKSGEEIDVAIIDLGLGNAQRSGLGAVAPLQERGVSVAIHTDHQEQTRRLLFLYAAFYWFRPVALLAKTGLIPGQSREQMVKRFARDINDIYHGRIPANDLAAPFRPRKGHRNLLDAVIGTREDLRNWHAFVHYSSTKAVASALMLSDRTVENWVARKYDAIVEILHAADAARMDVGGAEIIEGGNRKNKDRQSVIHQFARSQSWFFADPVVWDRFRSQRNGKS